MAWFRKTQQKVEPPATKEDLWVVCSACTAHIFKEEWENSLKVCPKCSFHERLSARERIAMLIDPGSFREINGHITTSDPLKFVDGKGSYAEKAEEAKAKTDLNESVVTGYGKIHGGTVTIAVMDFRFLGGSLGGGTGDKILLASTYALKHKLPYIVVSASGGARMHEGIISLMQMPKTCAGISRLHRAGIPYISILTDPTTGGVSASFAMVGDLNIAEPNALIGFAGKRVIEQTIKQALPPGFQTSEYMLEHGFIDHIVARKEMKDFLHRILKYWRA